MKSRSLVLFFVASMTIISLGNCKAMARAAAKYWTKKQIKEFLNNCESSAIGKFGESKGKDFCGCAVDVVAEQYKNYEDVKDFNLARLLIAAKDCVK